MFCHDCVASEADLYIIKRSCEGVAAGIVTLLPLTNLDELFTIFISMGFTAKLHSFG